MIKKTIKTQIAIILFSPLIVIGYALKRCFRTKKKWCREHGTSCRDRNCPYEHLDEPPEFCNAMIKFEGTPHFGYCELDKDHEGNHKCLMFEWENNGEKVTKVHNSYRLRGMNLMKMRINRLIEK